MTLSSCDKRRIWNLDKLADLSLPILTENDVASFTLDALVLNDGYSLTKSTGFVWSDINPNPTKSDNYIASALTGSDISLTINWPVNTMLYVRAYAENKIGVSYSETLKIIWPGSDANLPIVQTINPNNISFFSINMSGIIQSDGGLPIVEQGFCYSTTNQLPSIQNNIAVNTSGNSSFSELISTLTENTSYYVRAYAKNIQGISYGNMLAVSTNNYYYPGETGYFGGLIVYSKEDTTGAWNFLEAAPSDVNGIFPWAFSNVPTNTSNSLGAARLNTLNIIQQLGPANPSYAALAAYYYPSGLNGWFLPSRDELVKMRESLYLNQLGNFVAEANYWSSSQDNDFSLNAWAVKMTNASGATATYPKTNQFRIRPIRKY